MSNHSSRQLREELASLERHFKRCRPLPGAGTRLEQTASGIRIHSGGDGGGAGTIYTGYCKVTPVKTTTGHSALIHDGAPDYSSAQQTTENAGYAVINDQMIELPTQTLEIVGNRGFISVQFSLDGSDHPAFSGYSCGETFPANANETISFVLATFCISGERLLLSQQHTGTIYGWIFRSCDEAAL